MTERDIIIIIINRLRQKVNYLERKIKKSNANEEGYMEEEGIDKRKDRNTVEG